MFLKKIKRFGDLTSIVKKTLINKNDFSYPKTITQMLSHLKGPVVKIAQTLATIPDALPESLAHELITLQTHAKEMPPEKVNRILTCEWGAKWKEKFHSFDLNAFAAASLGQVHKAILHTGEVVACKIQYPHIKMYIDYDLNYFAKILSWYQKFDNRLDPTYIMAEIKEHLYLETNYIHEMNMIKRFSGYGCVPRAYEDLSTERILVMEFMKANSFLKEAQKYNQIDKNNIAKNLFTMWYTPFFREGLLHTDAHPGNYLLSKDKTIEWLDFGSVRCFDTSFICGVKELYLALLNNNREQKMEAFKLWGFKPISFQIEEAITLWAKLIFDPILEDKIRPIQPNFSAKTGWEAAKQVYKTLKGERLTPPKTFIFMDRVAVTLGGVMMKLYAENNWHQIYAEILRFTQDDSIKVRGCHSKRY